jgi:hypothetical protein
MGEFEYFRITTFENILKDLCKVMPVYLYDNYIEFLTSEKSLLVTQ